MQQIERLATQASELTRQLLAYSGRGQFVVRPLDLGQLVLDMKGMLEVVVSKKAQLDFRCDDELPAVMADAAQMQQIVMNLVTNASDALEGEPGTITVRVRARPLRAETLEEELSEWSLEPGTYLSLSVSDDGCGMNDETRERLFDPFFSTKVDGRGLGMSAVLGIVRGHRGPPGDLATPA
ncbi:MAG: ATP-binding protein [Sandaracinaceae bacterium]